MNEDKVDRVAEVIRDAYVATGLAGPRPAWMNVPEDRREKWRTMARSAIAEIGTDEIYAEALEEAAKTIRGYIDHGADGDASASDTAEWLEGRAARLRGKA